MTNRREYEMTEAQLDRLLDACKPVPYMIMAGMPPPSPGANANAAWAALGQKLGFESMTVRPVAGKGQRSFTAEPTDD